MSSPLFDDPSPTAPAGLDVPDVPVPDIPTRELTTARRNGLAVLLAGYEQHRPVYESNTTSTTPDDPRLRIYWQTLDWMRKRLLATDQRVGSDGGGLIFHTPAGLAMARHLTGQPKPKTTP